tara:strand:+ start:531 stop:863 length:333 start_codon:yes stop_codon:yes gene_type:complete
MTKLTKQQQLSFEKISLTCINSLVQEALRVQNNEAEKLNHQKTDIWLRDFWNFLEKNNLTHKDIYSTELKNIVKLISFAIDQRDKGNKGFFENAEREGLEIRQEWQRENL